MITKEFFDSATFTLTYVVYDEDTLDAVVIDPVLDFDPVYWRTSDESIRRIKEFVSAKGLSVGLILDTHAHADHLTGMEALRLAFEAPTAIGSRITTVQHAFAGLFDQPDLPADGRQWDTLLDDGDTLTAGTVEIRALHTPGHTPACMSYVIGDSVYTGDALFMPDYGTGRCDFPNGDAGELYDSITKKLYSLPSSTRVFVGHDYLPGGRDMKCETTIGASKERNIRLPRSMSKAEFVAERKERDRALEPPRLILQSLQVNIDAGRLPEPASNGRRYLRFPLNTLGQ